MTDAQHINHMLNCFHRGHTPETRHHDAKLMSEGLISCLSGCVFDQMLVNLLEWATTDNKCYDYKTQRAMKLLAKCLTENLNDTDDNILKTGNPFYDEALETRCSCLR